MNVREKRFVILGMLVGFASMFYLGAWVGYNDAIEKTSGTNEYYILFGKEFPNGNILLLTRDENSKSVSVTKEENGKFIFVSKVPDVKLFVRELNKISAGTDTSGSLYTFNPKNKSKDRTGWDIQKVGSNKNSNVKVTFYTGNERETFVLTNKEIETLTTLIH
jgi:exopolysaccharide biosynthesis predicted pyruvyltransferase EpsI